MENRKYKIKRDDVCIGEVIQSSTIYRYSNNTKYCENDKGYLAVFSAYGCRSMLFVPDENNLASDLLYDSPNYPILNISNDDDCLSLGDEAIVLREAVSLAPLLQYYGYPEELGYEDIEKIRKQFFYGSFARDNSLLFGFKPVMADDLYWHKHGKRVKNPLTLKRLHWQYEWNHRGNNRRYRSVEDGPFPREYFDMIDSYGDISMMQAILWHKNPSAFVPDKKEGKVKKLSKF